MNYNLWLHNCYIWYIDNLLKWSKSRKNVIFESMYIEQFAVDFVPKKNTD